MQIHVQERHQAGGADQERRGHQSATLRCHKRLTGDGLIPEAHRQGGLLQDQSLQEVHAAHHGQGHFAQEVVPPDDFGVSRLRRRRQAKEQAVALLRFLAAEVVQRHRLAAGDAQQEVLAAPYRAARQARQALDHHGVGVPGDRLVVDDQAAFFIAVVHGLPLDSRAGKGPQVSPCPVAPVPDPGPHRGPPAMPPRNPAAPGKSDNRPGAGKLHACPA